MFIEGREESKEGEKKVVEREGERKNIHLNRLQPFDFNISHFKVALEIWFITFTRLFNTLINKNVSKLDAKLLMEKHSYSVVLPLVVSVFQRSICSQKGSLRLIATLFRTGGGWMVVCRRKKPYCHGMICPGVLEDVFHITIKAKIKDILKPKLNI